MPRPRTTRSAVRSKVGCSNSSSEFGSMRRIASASSISPSSTNCTAMRIASPAVRRATRDCIRKSSPSPTMKSTSTTSPTCASMRRTCSVSSARSAGKRAASPFDSVPRSSTGGFSPISRARGATSPNSPDRRDSPVVRSRETARPVPELWSCSLKIIAWAVIARPAFSGMPWISRCDVASGLAPARIGGLDDGGELFERRLRHDGADLGVEIGLVARDQLRASRPGRPAPRSSPPGGFRIGDVLELGRIGRQHEMGVAFDEAAIAAIGEGRRRPARPARMSTVRSLRPTSRTLSASPGIWARALVRTARSSGRVSPSKRRLVTPSSHSIAMRRSARSSCGSRRRRSAPRARRRSRG